MDPQIVSKLQRESDSPSVNMYVDNQYKIEAQSICRRRMYTENVFKYSESVIDIQQSGHGLFQFSIPVNIEARLIFWGIGEQSSRSHTVTYPSLEKPPCPALPTTMARSLEKRRASNRAASAKYRKRYLFNHRTFTQSLISRCTYE